MLDKLEEVKAALRLLYETRKREEEEVCLIVNVLTRKENKRGRKDKKARRD